MQGIFENERSAEFLAARLLFLLPYCSLPGSASFSY